MSFQLGESALNVSIPATKKLSVRNAPLIESRNGSPAFPSPLIPMARSGIVLTAASKAVLNSRISPKVVQWAENRRISRKTLERLGVESAIRFFPESGEACEVIAFPYRRGNATVNTKYRAIESKMFCQETGGELRFWGLDDALKGPLDCIVIVEGEADRAAFVEAGWEPSSVLSVPNGAPVKACDNPEDQDRYRYVDAALKEGLQRAKKFILATDNDPPGMALRQDLIRLLGAARCWFVDWPSGIKDANEFLIKFGAEDLQAYMSDGAREWPVEGLYRLSEMPELNPLETWSPGFPEWESKLRFARRTVSLVIGQPGHGKTVLMEQVWYQICRDYGVVAAVASFETRPKPHARKNLRQFMYGKSQAELTDSQVSHADKWIDEHFVWMVHPNRKPSLKWLLEMAEIAVIRNNARIIQIDPWNKLESDRPDRLRETDWIGQCLDECMDFAHDLNVHLQILAHPSKPDSGFQSRPPQLYDAAGSAHWNNKIDLGLSIYRPKLFENGKRCTEAQLFVQKVRFEELGYPCRLDLNYDLNRRSYYSVDYQTAIERKLAG